MYVPLNTAWTVVKGAQLLEPRMRSRNKKPAASKRLPPTKLVHLRLVPYRISKNPNSVAHDLPVVIALDAKS